MPAPCLRLFDDKSSASTDRMSHLVLVTPQCSDDFPKVGFCSRPSLHELIDVVLQRSKGLAGETRNPVSLFVAKVVKSISWLWADLV